MTDASSLPASGPPTWRGRVALAVKLAISLGVMALLATRIDLDGMATRLSGLAAGPLLVGVALKGAGILFSAERWRWAARACGARIGALLALKLTVTGLFFGQVLPGALGSDVARAWLTYRAGCSPTAVVTAVILDRLLALVGVVLLLFIGLPYLLPALPEGVAWAAVTATAGLAVGVAVGLQADRIPLPDRLRMAPIRAVIGQVTALRRAFLTRSGMVAGLHALAVHLTTIVAVVVFARALHLEVGLLAALAAVPIAIFAAALPISLNGWGVREGAMAAGLALYGIPAGDAVVLSVLIGLSVMVLTLPGGLIWLTLKNATAQRQNGNGSTRGM